MKAALFDFDETMIDLEPQHDAAHRALCADRGCDYDALPESFRFGSGRRIVDDIAEMQAFFGWEEAPEKLYEIRHGHFLEALNADSVPSPRRNDGERGAGVRGDFGAITTPHPYPSPRLRGARGPRLMPGVERVVRELHARGMTLAITTSADGDAVELLLERFGIRELFALIVDGREVREGKPDPEGYLLTARKLGIAPLDCVVFEDSHVGVLAAKAAGMFCVAVRNPRARTPQDLSAADLVLESFEELNVDALRAR